MIWGGMSGSNTQKQDNLHPAAAEPVNCCVLLQRRTAGFRRLVALFLMPATLFTFVSTAGCSEKLTADERAVRQVLVDYTSALKRGDFPSAYSHLSEASREQVTAADFVAQWTKTSADYTIESFVVVNASVLDVEGTKFAAAVVRRTGTNHGANRQTSDRIDYHLTREGDSWRVIRTDEVEARMLWHMSRGDTAEARPLAALCLAMDPLAGSNPDMFLDERCKSRPASPPAAVAIGGKRDASPSEREPRVQPSSRVKNPAVGVSLAVESAALHSDLLRIKYVLTNDSDTTTGSVKVRAVVMKRDRSAVVVEKFHYAVMPFSPGIEPGASKTGELVFIQHLNADDLRGASVDMYVSSGLGDWKLAQQAVPMDIPTASNDIAFTTIGTSFERGMTEDMASYAYFARVDFRVTNTSSKAIKLLVARAVWKEPQTGEVVDVSETYVVSSLSDVQLDPGESRKSWLKCGRGQRYSPRAVVADFYLSLQPSSADDFQLVASGISVR